MKIHDIDKAHELLNTGNLVAIPTETVYGLAAMVNNPKAIEQIFIKKERPFFDPLIVHISGIEQAKKYTINWDDITDALAQEFWPGPLTLVVAKNKELVNDMITSGLSTVGLRCPRHPLTLDLLKKIDTGLAAPSANKFTKTSPTSADHVIKSFDNEIAVLEGDFCEVGLESTIVEVDQTKQIVNILRPGMITHTQIESFLMAKFPGIKVQYLSKEMTPGNMSKHYAPDAKFHFINIGQDFSAENSEELILPEKAQLAARQVYSKLHAMNDKNKTYFFQMKTIHQAIEWIPIIDRLKKAAG